MTVDDRVLFLCARQCLGDEHRQAIHEACASPSLSWQRMARLAERHKIAPLLWKHLSSCGMRELGVPAEIEERLELRAHQIRVQKERTARRIVSALAWLNARSVDVMLLKGASLDVLIYEEPWLTGPSDADLVLRCKRGSQLFEETWRYSLELYDNWLECDYFAHHDITMNGALAVDFESIWSTAGRIDYRGQTAWVMAPSDLLLSLCINSCRKRFFRLKSLCDVAEAVRRLPGLDWGDFARRVRETECEGIAYVALWIAHRTVGCELSEEILAGPGLGRARRNALQLLVRMLLRNISLEALSPGWGLRRGNLVSLLLPYASYRVGQAWQSFRLRSKGRSGPQSGMPAPRAQAAIPCSFWHSASALDWGALPRRRLGSTGLAVSAVGVLCGAPPGAALRLARDGGVSESERRMLATLWRGLELGVSHFDVANLTSRGRSEEILGKLLSGVPRNEVVISVGVTCSPNLSDPQARSGIQRQLEASLHRLGTDSVDVCHLHFPGFGEYTRSHLAALTEALLRVRERVSVGDFGLCLGPGIADGLRWLDLAEEIGASVLRLRLPVVPAPPHGWRDLLAGARARGLSLVLVDPFAGCLSRPPRTRLQVAGGAGPAHPIPQAPGSSGEETPDLQSHALPLAFTHAECLVVHAENPAQLEAALDAARQSLRSGEP
jgi:aryl-alcohol dehydrogenase-like predicted oxidoreductase